MDPGKVTRERFEMWRARLAEHDSTPLMALGLTSDNDLIVVTCDGIEVEEMLKAALIHLLNARVGKRGAHVKADRTKGPL
jgi:hypothetical protein